MPLARVLVVDDQSTDRTIEIVEDFVRNHSLVELIVRTGPKGLGSSYREGFERVFGEECDVIVSMDADFSHDPKAIPQLVAAVNAGADMAIGSRYVVGGSCVGWPLRRQVLSRAGNTYARVLLGLRVRDCTSGFRAYRVDTLRAANPETTKAEGYAFLTEIVTRTSVLPLTVTEVPITFTDRQAGNSKMSLRIILESMMLVTRWGVRYRVLGKYQ